MSERQLVIECIPKITEITIVIMDMSAEQYERFKKEQLEDTARTCPKALGFIKNIFKVIEYTLAMQYLG